jgi:glycolate oxidase FAD binding subunit
VARPETVPEAAALLKELGAKERTVRPVGGGTKPWGRASDEEPLETGGLSRILEHNVGDFTAVLEAGTSFAEAQAAFAEHRQRIAWDPPDPSAGKAGRGDEGSGATIGGIVATNDSGPLRHRYGGVRDLVVGITVVLSDGTVAKSGGKVIKNVAGYDLAKLFSGSFGTLGLIASLAVRLHPLPEATATVTARADDPDELLRAVVALAQLPLEADCFDVTWQDGEGRLALQFSGATATEQADRACGHVPLDAATEDHDWAAHRALQRSSEGATLKVSGRPTDLPDVIRAAQTANATVVSRAALGLSWLAFAPGDDLADRVATVRQALSPRTCTVLDGADRVADQWPDAGGAQVVMERLKARFDPARIFRPGAFVGGI